ncbi:MAG: acetate--CoA ligase family protein [Desulfobulbaceae bacterium]|nr:acetate--CoA ligase family protein [Desulfobulbaceae bacterium]
MLETLFSPKSVAVIGASSSPSKVGHVILSNLIKGGFQGPIVPVNPSVDEILGARCYSSIKEYGDQVELSVIVRPRQYAEEAVRDSLAAGCRTIILISSGFKEAGEEGFAIEEKITSLCKSRGVRLLGPNCLGVINTEGKINASFAGDMPYKGGISIISQSGAICAAMLDQAATHHLGLAKMVSMGNKADISEVDLLRFLARDKQTKVVAGYLEDIKSGDDFVKAAEEASTSKPVIILKAGTTAAGLKAAASHTGVLAGTDTAYGAAFMRSGVIRADTFQDLFDYASAFSLQPLPKGKKVLIITNAGGPGTLVADAVEKAGLEVAVLDRNISSALREKLPEVASTGNPIDVLGDADPERYAEAIRAAQNDDSVDSVIVILTPQAMTRPAETALAIAAQINGEKPVFASFMGGEGVMPGRAELSEAGLPDYDSPERAVAAIKAMYEYSAWKQRPPRVVTRFPVNRRRVERIITRNQRTNRLHLGEVKAKSILEAYGFRIPEGHLAATSDEAVEIAKRFGFPAAMKIVSPDIVHKSDLGGVRLKLATADAVRDAYDLMMIRIREKAPQARIEGVYVEEMIDPGLEVIIGMNRDPQFGPMLMFGLGGIFVEVMKDVTFHLAPITSEEAKQMLLSTRSYEIMEGKRGQHGVDLEAIANGLQRISQLTTDFSQIEELDINPFIVGEMGSEPVVADARMTLSKLI